MDIKELRIGNHVLVDDVRAKVCEINYFPYAGDYQVIVEADPPQPDLVRQVGVLSQHYDLHPILITEELLKELGFKKETENTWAKYFDKSEFCLHITFLKHVTLWLIDKNRKLIKPLKNDMFACDTLHKLENFVYMAIKRELI